MAQRLAEDISSRKALCAVVGLGVIGSETLRLLVERGFAVIGYDKSPEAVTTCATKLSGRLSSVDLQARDRLGQADVIFIAIRLRYHEDRGVDIASLCELGRILSEQHERDQLIILQSTVPPGVTRRFAEECLTRGNSHAFFIAHCPERLQQGNLEWRLDNIPRLIGGLDPVSGELAEHMIGAICDSPVRVASPEVSEFSKLLENVFIANGVALVGELTRLAHAYGVVAAEVTEAAISKPFGYFGFHPGTGVGGHCIPNDLGILREAARSAGMGSLLLDGIADALGHMPQTVVERTEQLSGGQLPSTVLIIGVGFKVGSSDTTASPAVALIAEFRKRGTRCCYIDSGVSRLEVGGELIQRTSIDKIGSEDIGACIIASGDANESLRDLCDAVSPVLDAGGARIMRDYGAEKRLHSL